MSGCQKVPAETQDLSLQRCHIPIGVLVDDSLVTDVLGPAGKLQRAERLLCTHAAGAHIGNDHGLGIPS